MDMPTMTDVLPDTVIPGVVVSMMTIIMIAAALFGLLVYMAPALVVLGRHHRDRWLILLLTVLTGWTFIGWLALFIWAIWPAEEHAPPIGPYRPFAPQAAFSDANPSSHALSPEAHLAAVDKLERLYEQGILTREEMRAHMNALIAPTPRSF
ncbi:superinfection immunity protein [Asaia lannensis]|uniref:superinfection immunity protein n=1 Tax=Asaia lannensis TaxID=415421 RepID=UPI001C992AE2